MKTFLYTFLTVMAALAVSPSFGQSPEGVPGVSVSDLKALNRPLLCRLHHCTCCLIKEF